MQCLQGFGKVEIITKPFYVCRMDILISFRGAQESSVDGYIGSLRAWLEEHVQQLALEAG